MIKQKKKKREAPYMCIQMQVPLYCSYFIITCVKTDAKEVGLHSVPSLSLQAHVSNWQ